MNALALKELPQVFDNLIDCGLIHVFSDADRKKYVTGLAAVVEQGGRVFLMCFSDEEPGGAGPRRISQAERQAAFSDDRTIESISPSRFEIIPEYIKMFSEGPKAWCVMVWRT